MTTFFFNFISRLEHFKFPYYCGLQERRQFVCFLFTTFVELFYIPETFLVLMTTIIPPSLIPIIGFTLSL